MMPPIMVNSLGPYLSRKGPVIGIKTAKKARKRIKGSKLSVAPTLKSCSNGFLNTLQA
jgi:hypothetical protein